MIKMMKYAGCKDKFLHLINPEINRTQCKTYIEPFCGSAAVFFNLEKEFDSYFVNDLDSNVIRILKSFSECEYSDIVDAQESVNTRFGDIRESKEAYYNFRNTFNAKLWKSDTTLEGICLWILYNSCLNSLSRFGPNGFNQSFGHRNGCKSMNESVFAQIKSKLNRAVITNMDFFKFIETHSVIFDRPETLMFLDPPYIKRPAGYKTITDEFYIRFIDFLKNTECKILYTDIDHDDLDWAKITLRDQMQNRSPNRKSEYTDREIMFYNF
jgi:DNA adenine methylase